MEELQDGTRWMVRFDAREDLFEALTAFARRHAIRAGSLVQGIGMLSKATIGYWDGTRYVPEEIAVPHELIALHGSIAEEDGAPSLHLHAALGGPDHLVIGGHLLHATVGILVEAYLESFPGRAFSRPMYESFGLRRLELNPGRPRTG